MSGTNSYACRAKEYAALIAILLLFGLFLAHKQDMSIVDIGRHIRNGEFFFKHGDGEVLWTNYYSYTEPTFSVLNHHWGAGVIFYLVWRWAEFPGLHLFFIALYLLSFGIFFHIAKRQSGLIAAGISAILTIPLLALRTEIRPEIFSYLFAGIFLLLLTEWREKRGKCTHLFVLLPLMEVLWVNLHIYFVLGPAIIGVFWLESIFRSRQNAIKLLSLAGLTFFATLLNPFGFKGASAPFTIFRNYGFSIGENQPVWYIDKFFGFFSYDTLYFKIYWAFVAATFILAVLRRRSEVHVSNVLLAVAFSMMAWFAIRNMALFGLVSIPIVAANIAAITDRVKERFAPVFLLTTFVLLLAAIVLYGNGMLRTFFRLSPEAGLGLATGNPSAAEFIRKNHLQGPIFNNYDAGGYLIYYLFPEHKVFVDNRPEAYSEDFFKHVYLPMQFSEAKWNEIDAANHFRTIIIARRNPEMSFFINARVNDPRWRCVFDDPFFLIFSRR